MGKLKAFIFTVRKGIEYELLVFKPDKTAFLQEMTELQGGSHNSNISNAPCIAVIDVKMRKGVAAQQELVSMFLTKKKQKKNSKEP